MNKCLSAYLFFIFQHSQDKSLPSCEFIHLEERWHIWLLKIVYFWGIYEHVINIRKFGCFEYKRDRSIFWMFINLIRAQYSWRGMQSMQLKNVRSITKRKRWNKLLTPIETVFLLFCHFLHGYICEVHAMFQLWYAVYNLLC